MAKATTVKANKTKMTLQDVKQIGFWVGVPVAVLLVLFFGSKSMNKIKEEYTSKTGQYESEKSATDKIASDAKHPNDETIKLIQDEKDLLAGNIFSAWSSMYQDQRTYNRWPQKLSREFLDFVEDPKTKFGTPIDPKRPYLLEDYGYYLVNNIPELLKDINLRRAQLKEYTLVTDKSQNPPVSRFQPVFQDPEEGLLYVVAWNGTVYLYDDKEFYLEEVEDSQLRSRLAGLTDRVPFYRELDPMISSPRDYVTSGAVSRSSRMSPGGPGGPMGGPGGPGGMDDLDSPGGPMGGPMAGPMAGPSGPGGPGGPMGGPGAGTARSSARGGMGSSMLGSKSSIPGYGIDPAVMQVQARAADDLIWDPDYSFDETTELYPGLPMYEQRVRIVGNIDWTSPEVFKMITWGVNGVPMSVEVWYLQEDLWVYNSIIGILVETNRYKPASDEMQWTDEDRAKIELAKNDIAQSPVKRIEQMLIGQDAGAAWQTMVSSTTMATYDVSAAGGMGGPGGGMGMGMGVGVGMGGSMSSGGMGSSGSGFGSSGSRTMSGGSSAGMAGAGSTQKEQQEAAALQGILYGRYLDEANQPIYDGSGASPYAEFKKMPVMLRLVIDQRRISDLLVCCANSPMPIDVRHLRVCLNGETGFGTAAASMRMAGPSGPGGPGGPMGGPSGPGGPGGPMGGPSGPGGPGGPAGGQGGYVDPDMMDGPSGPGGPSAARNRPSNNSGGISVGRGARTAEESEYGADVITIELYGVIRLYTEPDKELLGTGNAEEGEKDEGKADAAGQQPGPNGTAPNGPGADQGTSEGAEDESGENTAGQSDAGAAAAGQNQPSAAPQAPSGTDTGEDDSDNSEEEEE